MGAVVYIICLKYCSSLEYLKGENKYMYFIIHLLFYLDIGDVLYL